MPSIEGLFESSFIDSELYSQRGTSEEIFYHAVVTLLYSSEHQTRKLFLDAWRCLGILTIADLAEMRPLSTQN